MNNKVKIYIRKNTWDAYIVSDDGDGAPITISVNKNNMDEDIYAAGWEAYRDKQIDSGATVETYAIVKLTKGWGDGGLSMRANYSKLT